jgi:hypothetical protein
MYNGNKLSPLLIVTTMLNLFKKNRKEKEFDRIVKRQLRINKNILKSLRDYDEGKKKFRRLTSKDICHAYEMLHKKKLYFFSNGLKFRRQNIIACC